MANNDVIKTLQGPQGPAGPAPSGPGNEVLATPNGGSGVAALRALVNNDLPIVSLSKGGTGVDNTSIAINSVFAGPASGAPGNAAFRSLVPTDLAVTLSYFSYLPNAKFVNIHTQYGSTAGPLYDVYTVPAGKRAILSSAVASINAENGPATFGNILLVPMLKVGGAYYNLSTGGGLQVNVPTSAVALSVNGGGIIAEAAEGFSLQSQPATNHLTGTLTAVAASTTTALTLSAVASSVNGFATYTGTITNGATSTFAGYTFTVTGFTNAANNGTFLCVGSSTTTLVLVNLSAAAETHAGTATTQSFATYTATSGTISGGANAYQGMTITVTGMVASNNNGTFLCLGGTSTTLILANSAATLATVQTGAATILAGFNIDAQIIEFDNTAALRTSKVLNPSGLMTLYTPSDSKNGALTAGYFLGGVGGAAGFSTGVNENAIQIYNGTGGTETVTAYYTKGTNSSGTLATASAAAGGFTMYTGVIPNGGGGQAFALTASANAVASKTVYTGTITGGGSDAFVGFVFSVTGFANAVNNGIFTCTASTTTTLTLTNASGSASTVQVAVANIEYLNGASVVISGFSNAGNNGTFTVVASTPTMLLVNNAGGMLESASAAVSVPNVASANNIIMSTTIAATTLGGGMPVLLNVNNGDSIMINFGAALTGAVYKSMAWCNVLEV